ncbi:MAG: hypothetical protein ABIZ07_08850 [Dermatophilaceae bacterium]
MATNRTTNGTTSGTIRRESRYSVAETEVVFEDPAALATRFGLSAEHQAALGGITALVRAAVAGAHHGGPDALGGDSTAYESGVVGGRTYG